MITQENKTNLWFRAAQKLDEVYNLLQQLEHPDLIEIKKVCAEAEAAFDNVAMSYGNVILFQSKKDAARREYESQRESQKIMSKRLLTTFICDRCNVASEYPGVAKVLPDNWISVATRGFDDCSYSVDLCDMCSKKLTEFLTSPTPLKTTYL